VIIIKAEKGLELCLQDFEKDLINADSSEVEETIETLKQLCKLTKRKADVCNELQYVWTCDNEYKIQNHKDYLLSLGYYQKYKQMLKLAFKYLNECKKYL